MLRLGFYAVSGLLALGAAAQTPAPPLPQVRHLLRVPPPPGGLVPYRRGDLWGYADTTGRVIIAPVLTSAPLFSAAGLVRIDAYYELPRQNPNQRPVDYDDYQDLGELARPQRRLFLNARGECLRVLPHEVALLETDGSLQLAPRYIDANAGRLEVVDIPPPLDLVQTFSWQMPTEQLTTRRLGRARLERRLAHSASSVVYYYPQLPDRLGYSAVRHRLGIRQVHRRRYGPAHRKLAWVEKDTDYALLDENGRRLTPYKYGQVGGFSEGLAVATQYERKGRPYACGLLDRQGHEVLPVRYAHVSAFWQGGAVVGVGRPNRLPQQPDTLRYGIVDGQGRWVLPPQADLLSDPDAAGLVRRRHVRAPADTVVEFLTMRGQPAFGTDWGLREASAFWQGKSWARTDAGTGLLDPQGRWVVPPGRYQQMQPMYSAAVHLNIPREDPVFARHQPQEIHLHGYVNSDDFYVDTTYLLVRRAGLYGIVRRATGQEVLPCRYDELTCWIGDYGSGTRQHQPYLLAAHGGRELAAGTYWGERYELPGRGPLFHVDVSPYRWLVADSNGRAATALLPQARGKSGFLTPENLVIVSREPDPQHPAERDCGEACIAVADTSGRLLLPYSHDVGYSGRFASGLTTFYPSTFIRHPQVPSHAFVTYGPDNLLHLLLASHGQLRDATGHGYTHLSLLAGGWHHTWYASHSVLISPQGTEISAPEGYQWDETLHQVGRLVPFANGTASVGESGFHKPVLYGKGGLITRGGRHLWEE
ncbi:MAG: WG repeat-containing protein [Janthinobacterium lividum]